MAHSGHEYAASGSSAPAMSFQGFSAFPGSMMEVTGPHEMQGLVQPSNSQHDNGLGMLQQLAQGPEQALWLQTELAKRPIQPGQSPLHWILWREKCEEGWDQFQAWQLALEDERRMTAQEGQANQIAAQQPQSYHHHPQQQQQQQPSYAATTINPAQLQQFQGPTQSFGTVPTAAYAGYVGGPDEDTRQGGHAHSQMHNVLPPSSFAAMPSAVSAVPHPATRDDIVEGYGIQLDPTQATSYEQAPEATRRSSGSSVPSTMHGSPLDNLSSSAPSGSLSPRTHHSLTVRRVRHSKRPIMARSVFDPSLPSPPKRIMSLWSSSSLSAKPSSAQIVSRQAVAGPGPSSSAAAGTEVASSEPSGPTTMADIRRLITPDNLKLGKPVGLFKLLRNRTIKDVQHPPLFTPDAAQLHEILVQLKNHAPPIYLLRMASDDKYALVLKKWLIRFGKDPKEWGKCIAPLLQVLSRTEMSYDTLTDFKFGRLAINMIDKAKEAGVDGIKDMETAWKHFKKAAIAIADEDKKRKADEESEGNKVVDSNSAKKQRSEDGTARPVKSETSHGSADMSFFGNTSTLAGPSRPRPKLPDIKKRDPSETAPSKLPASTGPPTPKPPMAPAASLLASTLNAFRQQGAVRPSSNQAVLSANAAISIDSPPAEVKPAGPKPNKKGHVVRFRDNVPDSGDLVMVKEFKEEAWELEKAPWQQDEDLGGKTAHQLDMAEGRALRTHETIEAEIDWYEPLLYEGGAEIPAPTPEVEEQEARERGILGVLYTAAEVPSDPDESGVRIVQRGLQTGTWYPIHHDTSAVPPAAQNAAILSGLQTSASVSELLGSLNRDLFVPPTQQPQVYSYGQSQPAPGANYNYYSQQSQPAASAQPYGGGGSAYQQWTYAGSSAAGTGGYAGYGYEQANDRDRDRRDWDRESGRYGRGGGGGGSGGGGRRHGTVVCKHWLKNACFKGENCTFRHSRD